MRTPTAPANPFFDTQLAQLETLRYRVYAHTTLTDEALALAVTVTLLVPDHLEDDAICARARTALGHFIATEWAMTAPDRVPEAPGYAQASLRATARLPPGGHPDMAARLRDACRDGVHLSDLDLTVHVPDARLRALVGRLRAETLDEIHRHVAGVTHLSGRPWRIGDLHFGAETTVSRPAGEESRKDSADTGGERVVLVTEVVLRAESATVH